MIRAPTMVAARGGGVRGAGGGVRRRHSRCWSPCRPCACPSSPCTAPGRGERGIQGETETLTGAVSESESAEALGGWIRIRRQGPSTREGREREQGQPMGQPPSRTCASAGAMRSSHSDDMRSVSIVSASPARCMHVEKTGRRRSPRSHPPPQAALAQPWQIQAQRSPRLRPSSNQPISRLKSPGARWASLSTRRRRRRRSGR